MSEPVEIIEGPRRWRFDPEFLLSNWECQYGNGCLGILDRHTPELAQGCCSHGADLGEGDVGQSEAMDLAAHAATLMAEQWQFYDAARESFGDDGAMTGIFDDAERTSTRVIDGACIFLNRPGFAGGEGCALHLAALADDESPVDWKPSVCWQLPIFADWNADPTRPEVADAATVDVRGWTRKDWGSDGPTMKWCCSEQPDRSQFDAFTGGEPVIESMRDELIALTGEEVYVELRSRIGPVDSATSQQSDSPT